MNLLESAVRRLARFAGTLIMAALVLYAVMFLLLHNDNVRITRYAEVSSNDNAYQLLIDVTDPSTPYGSHKIDLSVTDASKTEIVSKRLRLANDGKNIGSENIEAYWTGNNHVATCLRGEEQGNILVSIDISMRKVSISEKEC